VSRQMRPAVLARDAATGPAFHAADAADDAWLTALRGRPAWMAAFGALRTAWRLEREHRRWQLQQILELS